MSLILDALNRANKVPGHVTPPAEQTPPATRRSVSIIAITALVVAVVVVNTTVVIYFGASEAPAPAVDQTPAQPGPGVVNQAATVPPERVLIPQPQGTDQVTNVPVPIGALPSRIRAALPDLSLTSHIYSTDASLRMVNINDRVLHEGDAITRDVVLREITPDGVIMNYADYAIILSVTDSWSSDRE
ncbi:MAG: general secretion pathway protein GspB [Proteobacteria bacterium]|nr:general secretion pathway protein GspB [Pseudomonadota bacterium]MDA1300588.1 general secretion pathway protein GspB [Pseudomonadota bacterium]